MRKLWAGGSYVELRFKREDAEDILQPGPADETVEAVRSKPYMTAQLERLDPANIRAELKEYGAWNDDELGDEAQNLLRLVWVFGCQAAEEAVTLR